MTTTIFCGWLSRSVKRISQLCQARGLNGQIPGNANAGCVTLSLAGGGAAPASYARGHHELLIIPAEAWAGGLAAAIIVGALAGLLPAIRAARLSSTQALWNI